MTRSSEIEEKLHELFSAFETRQNRANQQLANSLTVLRIRANLKHIPREDFDAMVRAKMNQTFDRIEAKTSEFSPVLVGAVVSEEVAG
ncbi:hypothetical protein [Epibacterium ulvae]|uniref:hypothetical protein n=1 Tax=Epibacterium ulvae TaxID=1156985 RepID=UPI002492908C|nr:hypothetical protein [Epibacterium ulvae]